jgi:hypothetical protein
MPDPNPVATNTAGTATPAAPASKPAVPQEPAKPPAQPAPVAKPGDTPKPGDKPADTVPLAALMEERGKRQALEAEVALMKQSVQQQPQAPQAPFQQPPNQLAQEIDKLWDTDPRKGVQAEIMLAMDWYDRTNNSIDQQADVLAGKYNDFNDWRSSATRYVRSLPLNQRAQNGVLEMAYFIVRGQNVDTLLQRQNEDMLKKFQSGELVGGTPPGTFSAPAPQATTQLSQEQKNAAAAMGLSEEDYASQIKIKSPGGG